MYHNFYLKFYSLVVVDDTQPKASWPGRVTKIITIYTTYTHTYIYTYIYVYIYIYMYVSLIIIVLNSTD